MQGHRKPIEPITKETSRSTSGNIRYLSPGILLSPDDGLCVIKLAPGAVGIAGLPPNGHQRTPRSQLSAIKITEQKDHYRIILTDYENTELRLNPQEKALYVFFLIHSEGIRMEDLIKYEDEFSAIYGLFSNRDDTEKRKTSVRNLLCDGGVGLKSTLRSKRTTCNKKVQDAVADSNISWNYEIEKRRDRRYGIYLERRLVDMQNFFSDFKNLTKVRRKKVLQTLG